MIKYLSDFKESYLFYDIKCINFCFRLISFSTLTFNLFQNV